MLPSLVRCNPFPVAIPLGRHRRRSLCGYHVVAIYFGKVVVVVEVGPGWLEACREGLLSVRKLSTMVEGCPEVVEDVGREDVCSGMTVFPQLMGRACSLQLDIGVGTCGVGVLQLRDAGWHSGGNPDIAESPRLRIVGYSIGGVVLP